MRTGTHNRRGVALFWVIVMLLLFVGFVGLATDTLWATLVNHQLQNAADAASLAGARHVRSNPNQARIEAQTFANLNVGGTADDGSTSYVQLNLNDGNDPAGDIVLGRWISTTNPPTFDPTHPSPNAVRVRAPRVEGSLAGAQRLFFGHLFDSSHANIKRTATARTAGGLGAGLLILDPIGADALHLQGGPDLAVINGTIQVNSSSQTAVLVGGNYAITGEELNIVGSMANPPTTIQVNTGMPVLPDPLAWLEAPDTTNMTVHGDIFNPGVVTLDPGVYPYGMRMTENNNNVTCNPGVYVIGTPGGANQRGFVIQGGQFTANNCTFYIAAGSVDLTANANITISPPPLDQGYYYEHISIFQSRTNYSPASIWAGNDSAIDGTLYFPGQPDASPPVGYQFDLNGGGFGQGVQVICYRMRLGGNADLDINFDGWWPGPLFTRVYLVE